MQYFHSGYNQLRLGTVSIFIAGDSVEILEDLGVHTEFEDGIVFSRNNEPIKTHMVFCYDSNTYPRLSYWIERSPEGSYYKSYSYNNANLRAQKIKQDNGNFRYVLYG